MCGYVCVYLNASGNAVCCYYSSYKAIHTHTLKNTHTHTMK